MSLSHAVLKRLDGHWSISDPKSRNGTFVNGQLVLPDEEIPAENVDIFIGGYMFYIQDDIIYFRNIHGDIEFSPEMTSALDFTAHEQKKISVSEGEYISSLSTTNPGVIECLSIAQNVSRRLWERTPKDDDFLNLRLGTGSTESNVTVKIPAAQMSIEESIFTKQAKAIRDKHTVLTGIPVCHSLLNYPITGLVGRREDVIHTVWRLIMDIAAHHSGEDVKIICVYPEEERSQWEWMRWLPHVWYENRKKRYLAYKNYDQANEADKDKGARPLLREAAEILKSRRREIEPGKAKNIPTPFYVMILADRALTESCGEVLFPESSSLGFAAIYAYGDIGSLPGECQSVITCGDLPDYPPKIQPDLNHSMTSLPTRSA